MTNKRKRKNLKRLFIYILTVFLMTLPTISVEAATPNSIEEQIRATGTLTDEEPVVTTENAVSKNGISENNLKTDVFTTEAYNPCTTDAFMTAADLKGIQGNPDFSHYFTNCYLDTGFVAAGSTAGEPYVYQGVTYYFNIPAGISQSLVKYCNAKGTTVNVAFLLRYQSGKERLVDPAARSGGYNYYAPNFSEAGVAKEYEAFFHYLGEKFGRADCHIDNWILGNEENMPAFGRNHPTSTYYGTLDINTIITKYSQYFTCVYNSVRTYTTATRVSVSVDHSWQHFDEGRGFSTRSFLDNFCARVGNGTDWYISYHAYPAVLFEPAIWSFSAYAGRKLNQNSGDAPFVDGANLNIMTEYVKKYYGSNHRIMLTEVGFSQYQGENVQAASFAYTYYAARFNDMVDCLILHTANEGGQLNFAPTELMSQIFFKIDNGNVADADWIEGACLPVIGISSWTNVIPNYKKSVNKVLLQAFVTRLYNLCLQRDPDPSGFGHWMKLLECGGVDGANIGYGFFFSTEYKNRNLSDEDYVEMLYNVMMGRGSDAAGKANWLYHLKNGVSREGVYRGFVYSAEYNRICSNYGISVGTFNTVQARDQNYELTAFVSRLYTKALGRGYDEKGLNDWCQWINSGAMSVNNVAGAGFFHSQEFQNKNLSNEEYIKTLYRTFFDREYDQQGYDFWMDKLNKGASRDEVLNGFLYSAEFGELKAKFGIR